MSWFSIMFDKGQEIYSSFSRGSKIIYGIQNPNKKFSLLASYSWLPILIITLFMSFSLFIYLPYTKVILVLGLVISIFLFLSNYYKISFTNESLIIKNKLGREKIFNINECPQVYSKEIYRPRTSFNRYVYYLCIQQSNIKVTFNISMCSNSKIYLLLNNLIFKSEEYLLEKPEHSSNDTEPNYSHCKNFLNKQKNNWS